ncbi:GGDEF domain-containing protein [Paraglaciecola aquimarina]|uniref:diguanylate cyclase n=1 Tax=Paraglaciecola aquimarina TaxID=1235557 RepID=A0ABU3T021_9ALTE|nr:GGDEF domain-containing protein [Paraglaciecola aquimarina]MDU0355621.1 GGDEF domain-containing protein [Paraglaciecola aquimarina]
MEQLNQFYQENIRDSFFTQEQTNQGLSQLELNQFIQKLLTTIDISELAELYFEQLKTTLQLSSLKIQYEDNLLDLGDIVSNQHSKTLTCMDMNNSVATIIYGFSEPMSLRNVQVLQQMHIHFSYPLKNALTHYKIKQFAMKDFLTSLGNRASYEETIMRLVSHANRHQTPFGLIMLDMDNFKQVNDKHGHNEGDNVLVESAKTILKCLRDSDYAYRFGGDEFCCLLPEANEQTNQLIAERILAAIEESPLLRKHKVSCSIGSANFDINDNPISLFSRADEALYQAKRTGKNCIKAG